MTGWAVEERQHGRMWPHKESPSNELECHHFWRCFVASSSDTVD